MNTNINIWCGGWKVEGSTDVTLFKRSDDGVEALWEKVVEAYDAESVETNLFVRLRVSTRKNLDADFILRNVRDWTGEDYDGKLSLGSIYSIEDAHGNTIGEVPICHEGIIATFGVDYVNSFYITLPESAEILREGLYE